MLLLTSLAGCAMNDGDKMALTSSEQSAAPDVALIESDDNTITFEFGVGMTGPQGWLLSPAATAFRRAAMMMSILNIWRGRKLPMAADGTECPAVFTAA